MNRQCIDVSAWHKCIDNGAQLGSRANPRSEGANPLKKKPLMCRSRNADCIAGPIMAFQGATNAGNDAETRQQCRNIECKSPAACRKVNGTRTALAIAPSGNASVCRPKMSEKQCNLVVC